MNYKKFEIKNKIVFETPIDNYPPLVTLTSKHSTCKISLHGAHILSFKPNDKKDLLWLSSLAIYRQDKAIRGGIPICLPWFGGFDTPSHGFARISSWEIIESKNFDDEFLSITFRLKNDKFIADYYVEISTTLNIELKVKNISEDKFEFTQALHSYFNISDVKNTIIKGLENQNYIDSIDNNREKTQQGYIRIDKEIDRIYTNTNSQTLILDKGYKREIIISTKNSKSTVVWNPWIEKSSKMSDFDEGGYKKMLCIESANIGFEKIILQKGESHSLKVKISEKEISI